MCILTKFKCTFDRWIFDRNLSIIFWCAIISFNIDSGFLIFASKKNLRGSKVLVQFQKPIVIVYNDDLNKTAGSRL